METYILALDQGTTSSRCILFDHSGRKCAVVQNEFTQYFPRPGWVEHDPREILATQLGAMTEVQVQAHVQPSQIAAIGITNQRETTVVWNRHTGEPVYNAIVWQCRRTADRITQIVDAGWSERIREKTGLIPDAYFSASKIEWILDNVEGAREAAEAGDLLFGTIDTWLIWNLTAGRVHATDYTNVSRTMLFNIHTLKWDDELLELFGIPASMLPEVRDSSGDFGETSTSVLAGATPICGVAGDQQAALFGQCCFEPGEMKNTYGTGCFLLMNTGNRAVVSDNGLLTTIAIGLAGKVTYCLEGSVFVAGALIQWLRDEMGIISSARSSCRVAKSVEDNGGVYVVPAFTGLGAPYWDPYARGAIFGITRGTTRAHFVRAALESLAFQSWDVIETMIKDAGFRPNSLKVDGGACENDFLMQFQADMLDCDVVRPAMTETTALGAAYLAGLQVGYWDDMEELRTNGSVDHVFEPDMDEETRKSLLAGWHAAVARTLSR